MDQDAFEHLLYRFQNASISTYPFPHFYIENIFPANFYQELIENFPDLGSYISLSETGEVARGAYRERFVLSFQESHLSRMSFLHGMFWRKFEARLKSPEWISMLLDKFGPFFKERFGNLFDQMHFLSDLALVRDQSGYAIGPHTDHPSRILTLLFYCPLPMGNLT